ncbi:MAG: hypothetical protein WC551_05420 [Patescibacteria group bacterium]
MSSIDSIWKKLLPLKRVSPVDRYQIKVVTSTAELSVQEYLPAEIRFVLAVRPSRFETFRKLLEDGYGIGVRTVEKTPDKVLKAVDRISRETQANTVIPWLPNLLRNEELPVFSEVELRSAEARGVNLYEEARTILAERHEFRKIVVVDLHNRAVGTDIQRLMTEVNEDLYPLSIDAIVHRVVFDNAHTRTEIAQSIIKALILIGPIAHVLEHFLSGLGKIFAASVDDLLSETAELFALRGSGFTWRQLLKRSRILIPIFILATYGAFQVEPLIREGRVALAGAVFGLSAVALSLTTAIQSIFMYRKSYLTLVNEGKLKLATGQSLVGFALRQDFTNPARLGLFVGAFCSPFAAAAVFLFKPELADNGWILALLGSTESIVAGITVVGSARIERWLFRSKINRVLRNMVFNQASPEAR